MEEEISKVTILYKARGFQTSDLDLAAFMTTHTTTEQIECYLARRLPRADLGGLIEHVYQCGDCYQTLLAVLERRFPIEIDLDELAGLKGWHLQGRDLRAYIDGKMSNVDADYTTVHLEACGECRQQVQSASEYGLAHSRLNGRQATRPPATLSSYVAGFDPFSSTRLRLAALVVLMLGVAAILWVVGRANAPRERQITEVVPGETPAAQSSSEIAGPQPVESPARPGPTGNLRASESPPSGVSRRADQIELALVATNLAMPPVIAAFDRSPAWGPWNSCLSGVVHGSTPFQHGDTRRSADV